ncbi:MAG: MerR family transcriptional regulator [Acidobacteria bacterium]|nr:MerR family transcriptional regulator [Acidobacteriota bacterium]MDW7984807.1 MerR family transcriptional regulator [Acidobacteriota bacterium]
MPETHLKIGELAERAGVTPRTVHYYVHIGLLPPPRGRGRRSYYTEEHLRRLRIIRQLQRYFIPLRRIKEALRLKSLEEVEEEIARTHRVAHEYRDVLRTAMPTVPERTAWERIVLQDGLELHYRLPMGTGVQQFIEFILQQARAWFRAGPPEGSD